MNAEQQEIRQLHVRIADHFNVCKECSDFEKGICVAYPCNIIRELDNE